MKEVAGDEEGEGETKTHKVSAGDWDICQGWKLVHLLLSQQILVLQQFYAYSSASCEHK